VTDPPSQSTPIPVETIDPLQLAFEEQSDLGNAARLKALAGGKLKWIEDLQAWAWYDGKRFDPTRGAIAAQRIAHDVVRHIRDEARAVDMLLAEGDEELLRRYRGPKATIEGAKTLPGQLRKHALKSGSASMTAGMLRQARSDLAVLSEDFDRDALAYNVQNGTLRFVKVQPSSSAERSASRGSNHPPDGDPPGPKWAVRFDPHDPADQLMNVANVEYDPEATCPFWTSRLGELNPDGEQLSALHLLYGYSLTGLTSDQAFYLHHGKGNDGKSTTHQALADLHGDYFRHAGIKTFLEGAVRGGAEHRSDLVRLRGDVRFVTADEPKPRSTWDGEVIKQITGSLITARGAGERTEVTYRPRFKFHPECNKSPKAPSDDRGFRRRLKIFQWTVRLPAPGEPGFTPIEEVLSRIEAEKSGVLNWLIEGCLEWLEKRVIPQPAAMTALLKDFWSSSAPLDEWLDEWCDTSDPAARAPVKELYANFKDWFEKQFPDEKIPTSTKFGNDLREKQFAVVKDTAGNRWRIGLKLRDQGVFGTWASPPGAGHPPDARPAADPSHSPSNAPSEVDGGPSGAASFDPDDEDLVP